MLKGACFRLWVSTELERVIETSKFWPTDLGGICQRARADQDPSVWEGEEWDSLRNFTREVFSPGKVFPATT